jgi:hypothetical protein
MLSSAWTAKRAVLADQTSGDRPSIRQPDYAGQHGGMRKINPSHGLAGVHHELVLLQLPKGQMRLQIFDPSGFNGLKQYVRLVRHKNSVGVRVSSAFETFFHVGRHSSVGNSTKEKDTYHARADEPPGLESCSPRRLSSWHFQDERPCYWTERYRRPLSVWRSAELAAEPP